MDIDVLRVLGDSLWSGLFAGGYGIIFTAPVRYLAPAFLCGFAGRLARHLLMAWGWNRNWSTVVAAAVVVLVGVAAVRWHAVSPVVLISGLLPLGPAVPVFNSIVGLMKVSSLEGEALREPAVALVADIGKAFTLGLALCMGVAAGLAIVRVCRKERMWEDA